MSNLLKNVFNKVSFVIIFSLGEIYFNINNKNLLNLVNIRFILKMVKYVQVYRIVKSFSIILFN